MKLRELMRCATWFQSQASLSLWVRVLMVPEIDIGFLMKYAAEGLSHSFVTDAHITPSLVHFHKERVYSQNLCCREGDCAFNDLCLVHVLPTFGVTCGVKTTSTKDDTKQVATELSFHFPFSLDQGQCGLLYG